MNGGYVMTARRVRVVGAIAATLIAVCPADAARLGLLTSAKPWTLDYDEAQCWSTRDYGTTDGPIILVIRPGPNAETYELLIGRRRSGPFVVEELKGSVDFGQGPIAAWVLIYGGKPKQTVNQFRISASDMDQARSATSV